MDYLFAHSLLKQDQDQVLKKIYSLTETTALCSFAE